MKNIIVLDRIVSKENEVKYEYTIHGSISKYVLKNDYSIVYSCNISDVPLSILSVPFVGNFLPLAMACNAQIKVERLDKAFYDSVDKIRIGYTKMHPGMSFGGDVIAKRVENNALASKSKRGMFFSCGVDSTASLYRHIDEKPDLFSIYGEDTQDLEEWKKTESIINEICKTFSLNCYFAYSDFRLIFDYKKLDNFVSKRKDSWWHGFHHGIAIITHIAPLSYINHYEIVYIASTFDENMVGTFTCASDPLIDNNIKYANCETIHDGFELTRQDKIKLIVNFNKKDNYNVHLRVCYHGKSNNCSACEKCYRTALEIVSEGANPNDYGFIWGDEQIRRCEKDIKNNIVLNKFEINAFYKPTKKAFISNSIDDRRYDWFIDMDLDKFNKTPKKILFIILRYIKHKIFRL